MFTTLNRDLSLTLETNELNCNYFREDCPILNLQTSKNFGDCFVETIPTIIIHLQRHKSRFIEMEKKIKKTIIKGYKYFIAIDGNCDLFKYNFKVINNWLDPIKKDKMNTGAIACTLSHYHVWKHIVDNNIKKCLILEDDTKFNYNFNSEFKKLLNLNIKYDLLYLNRNLLSHKYNLGEETELSNDIVIPNYSYNTNAYIITYDGAKKLLNTDLLNNILPVDEFLSIMFDDNYPFEQFSKYFKKNIKLNALALKYNITNQESRILFESSIENTEYYIENT